MESQLMNQLGLASLDIGYVLLGLVIFVIILFITAIAQGSKLGKLRKKYELFMNGKDAKSLEKQVIQIIEENKRITELSEDNRKDIRKILKNQEYCYQKLGINKYDAFREMGGKLSFSIALLNKNHDGFIINSVHSTDGCYSYTKEIKNGQCEISLGQEEKIALDRAIASK